MGGEVTRTRTAGVVREGGKRSELSTARSIAGGEAYAPIWMTSASLSCLYMMHSCSLVISPPASLPSSALPLPFFFFGDAAPRAAAAGAASSAVVSTPDSGAAPASAPLDAAAGGCGGCAGAGAGADAVVAPPASSLGAGSPPSAVAAGLASGAAAASPVAPSVPAPAPPAPLARGLLDDPARGDVVFATAACSGTQGWGEYRTPCCAAGRRVVQPSASRFPA